MGTKIDSIFTPDIGRVLPQYPVAPGIGPSVVQPFTFSELGAWDKTQVDVSVFDEDLAVFFFSHDRVIHAVCHSEYTDATLTDTGTDKVVLPEPTYFENYTNVGTLGASHLAILTPSKTGYLPGEAVVDAVSVTNGVVVPRCYPGNILIKDRGLVDSEAAAIDPYVWGTFFAQGTQVDGYGVGTDYIPVILAEPDYTQAMKDDGNVFVAGGHTYRIVGLWAGNAR